MSTFRLLAAYVPAASGQAAALGTATATGSALPLGRLKATSLGVATSTSSAPALVARKTVAVGVATETSTAPPVTFRKARAVGVATETDSAGAITTTGPLGIAEETDTALPLTARKTRLLGVAGETDAALAIGRAKTRALGLAAETDLALAVGRRKTLLLGTAVSTNIALSISRGGILPAFISGEGTQVDGAGAAIEAASFYGPFKDGNGNLYTVTEDDANTFRTAMRKSTNGGVTWAEIDGANRPTNDDLESVWIVQAGTVLYLLSQPSGTSTLRHHTFNTSDAGANPDTWQVKAEAVNVPGTAPADQSVALVRRSDGDLVAFYRAAPVGGFQRIGYRIKTGGSWGAETLLDTTASKNFSQVQAVLGESDVTHIFYANETDGNVLHRTLSSADVLSSAQTINDAATKALRNPMANRVLYHDDAGTERVFVAWMRASDDKLVGAELVDGTPSADEVISDNALYHSPVNAGSFQPVAAIAADGGTILAVYADASTHDLFLSTRTAGTWGADEEVTDAVDAMGVSANVFTHSGGNGGKRVIAYTFYVDTGFDSGDKSYYDEDVLPVSLALGTATSTSTAPALGRLKTRLLAVAAETSAALPLARTKRQTLTVASETDTARPVERNKVRALVPSVESDLALALGRAKRRALGTGSETDSAPPVGVPGGGTVGPALETDTAIPLGRGKTRTIAPAGETDIAVPLATRKTAQIGAAVETSTAPALGRLKLRALATATTLDSALPVTATKRRPLGVALETDTAPEILRVGGIVFYTDPPAEGTVTMDGMTGTTPSGGDRLTGAVLQDA